MRTKIAALVISVIALVAALAGVSMAGAQETPTAVTDYDNYPLTAQALLTPGCDSSQLSGLTYSVNRNGTVATSTGATGSLAALGLLERGDIVTVTWSATGPACAGTPITLAIKSADAAVFDPSTDQYTQYPWSSNFGTADAGPGSVTYILPALPGECFYQLDAVLGAPLAVVGPSGSYYSPLSRNDNGPNTLISANNGEYLTTCTEPPTAARTPEPAPPLVEEPATTTTGPVTTEPPTVTVPGGQNGPYTNCTEARAAGYSNILRGAPQYTPEQDADNDGVACDDSPSISVYRPVPGTPYLAATGVDMVQFLLVGFCVLALGVMFLGLFTATRRQGPDQA